MAALHDSNTYERACELAQALSSRNATQYAYQHADELGWEQTHWV